MKTYYRHITINDTTEKGSECQYELFVAVATNPSNSLYNIMAEAYLRYASSPMVHYEGRWLTSQKSLGTILQEVVLPRRKFSYESIVCMDETEYNFITDPKNTVQ